MNLIIVSSLDTVFALQSIDFPTFRSFLCQIAEPVSVPERLILTDRLSEALSVTSDLYSHQSGLRSPSQSHRPARDLQPSQHMYEHLIQGGLRSALRS